MARRHSAAHSADRPAPAPTRAPPKRPSLPADFHLLAAQSLAPAVRNGVDVRATLFAVCLPPAVLARSPRCPPCPHGPGGGGTGACLKCHDAYADGMGGHDGSDGEDEWDGPGGEPGSKGDATLRSFASRSLDSKASVSSSSGEETAVEEE
ncbi:hypothetical protein DFJ74DRAFT_703775 [Hyaloraphidium curvatum]|nr:hypothetical protein DFJ74DRAFT_703775 [Hyaloraphidium curvatum]